VTARLKIAPEPVERVADKVLRHLNAHGVPIDPLAWEAACAAQAAIASTPAERVVLQRLSWAPLTMLGSGRIPVRWVTDGLWPIPMSPDLAAIPAPVLACIGDGRHPVAILFDRLLRPRALASLSGDPVLLADIESGTFDGGLMLRAWLDGKGEPPPDFLPGGRYEAAGAWASTMPDRAERQRDAERAAVLRLAHAVILREGLDLLAVSAAGVVCLAADRGGVDGLGADIRARWGWSWGEARSADFPEDEPPTIAPLRERAVWAEDGLTVATHGNIEERGARLAVSIATLDLRAQLKAILAGAPNGGRREIKAWSQAARERAAAANQASAVGVPRLTRGTHAELAEALRSTLVDEGQLLTHDGLGWRRSFGTTWEGFTDAPLSVQLQRWDGAPVGDSGDVLKVSAGAVEGSLRLLTHLVAVPPDYFDTPTPGVVLGDRILLDTGDDRPITEHDRIRAEDAIDCRITDPRACPHWLRFLSDVFRDDYDRADRTAYLQEWLGAALWGEATRYRGLPVLLGHGSNGKGTFISTVQSLFSPAAQATVDLESLGGNHAEYYVVSLKGKRLNAVGDMNAKDVAATGTFKSAVLGEAITGRDPGGKPITFRPQAAWLIALNDLPRIADSSTGLYERFVPMRFKRHFSPNDPATVPAEEMLAGLRAERLGIIFWALEGLHRLRAQRRYTIPPSSIRLRRSWVALGDDVRAWILAEMDIETPGAHVTQVRTAEAHVRFQEWCKEQRLRPDPVTVFGKKMSAAGFVSKVIGGARVYEIPWRLDDSHPIQSNDFEPSGYDV